MRAGQQRILSSYVKRARVEHNLATKARSAAASSVQRSNKKPLPLCQKRHKTSWLHVQQPEPVLVPGMHARIGVPAYFNTSVCKSVVLSCCQSQIVGYQHA